MDKRSTEGRAGEWRKQGFSGQTPCRSSMGAACRGTPALALDFLPVLPQDASRIFRLPRWLLV